MDNQTGGHRDRVREKLFRLGSIESYQAYEVLEFLLFHSIPRRDTKTIAKNLIKTFGSLGGVLSADVKALMKQPGVGRTTALFLHSLSQLPSYVSTEKMKFIAGSGDLGNYATRLLRGKNIEEFYAIALNSKQEIISYKKMSSGTFSSVSAEPRDLIMYALDSGAEKLALVHNHTNGSILPSGEDLAVTDRLYSLAKAVGVTIVDHIITCEDRYYSFADNGKMPR